MKTTGYLIPSVRAALRRGDCDQARMLVGDAQRGRLTARQQTTVRRLLQTIERCEIKHGGVGRARRRRALGEVTIRRRGPWRLRQRNPDRGEVDIRYGAVPSPRTKGAWAPRVVQNGKASTGWIATDRDTAVKMAGRDAEERASRYSGDWDVEIRPLTRTEQLGRATRGRACAANPGARKAPASLLRKVRR